MGKLVLLLGKPLPVCDEPVAKSGGLNQILKIICDLPNPD